MNYSTILNLLDSLHLPPNRVGLDKMGGDVSQPHERSKTKDRAPPAIMTSNDVQPGPVQSTSLLEESRPPRPKLKLSAGQPPRSEDERLPKRANDSTDSDSIDARGSKRSKVNNGSALEAPLRRRSTSSKRDSEANTTKSADRLAVRLKELKDEYENSLDGLKKTRDTNRETGLNQAGKPLEPLCAAYGIYVANWTPSDLTIHAVAGYLNLYCPAQVGGLWTVCRVPLKALYDSYENSFKTTGGVFEKVGLTAFMKSLDDGVFSIEDITSTVEPTEARATDGTVSEHSRFLMLARFIHQVFDIIEKHRQQDHDFPNVFSGAGEGQNPRVLFKGSLDWITEDMYRALALWASFAPWVKKRGKRVDDNKYSTRNRGSLVLPIFLQRPVNNVIPLVASRPATYAGQDLVTRPAESSVTGSLPAKKRADPLADFLTGHGISSTHADVLAPYLQDSSQDPSSAAGCMGTRRLEPTVFQSARPSSRPEKIATIPAEVSNSRPAIESTTKANTIDPSSSPIPSQRDSQRQVDVLMQHTHDQAAGAFVARAVMDELSRRTPDTSTPAAFLPINKPNTVVAAMVVASDVRPALASRNTTSLNVNMAIEPAMSNPVDHSITTGMPLDRLASFTELNSTANVQPNALTEKTKDHAPTHALPQTIDCESARSGKAPMPPSTDPDVGQPGISAPTNGSQAPSQPSSRGSQAAEQAHRPSISALAAEIKTTREQNAAVEKAMQDKQDSWKQRQTVIEETEAKVAAKLSTQLGKQKSEYEQKQKALRGAEDREKQQADRLKQLEEMLAAGDA
ncbi:hypothetical protein LTR17_006339 [Elasticomyces elasticus]|nr:hypothetical protein LTR17_006339 [Elasticomyces elasticus]